MEFKAKTATEALEKIANAPLEHHWGCDQILIDGLHFSMDNVQDYAKATLNNQPKLSIPKKIADLADKEAYADPHTKFKMFIERYELGRFDDKLNLYCCSEDGRETAFAYINPLTRPLVEVTDE